MSARGKPKVLLTGASGFVGRGLADHFLAADWQVMGTGRKPISPDGIDYISVDLATGPDAAEKLVASSGASLVLHTAGVKDVRWCEANARDAYRINADVAEWLAQAAKQKNLPLVIVSTDLVFAGDHGDYREEDPALPATVYGKSKLEGEQRALAAQAETLVCRTGGVYGRGSPLLRWLRDELSGQKKIDAFTDVKNTPTYLADLGQLIERLVEERGRGIYHTCGPQKVSRFDWFRAFAAVFGFSTDLVRPAMAGAKYRELMLFPDSSVSSEKAYQVAGFRPRSLHEAFTHLRQVGGP